MRVGVREIAFESDDGRARLVLVPDGGGAAEFRSISKTRGEDMEDSVGSPSHYAGAGVECKDALKSTAEASEGMYAVPAGGLMEYRAIPMMAVYWWGCAFKYLWRWPRKNGLEDLRKARQCLDFLIEEIGGDSREAR